jgi:ribokinase
MTRILISGLINIETTLRIDQFPIPYFPVAYPFNGVNTTISGVGFNIAKALHKLSNTITLVSLIGSDTFGTLIPEELIKIGITPDYLRKIPGQNPQSVILYDTNGTRQIHVDLKNIQELRYPVQDFEQALTNNDVIVLCNINFSRPFLEISKNAGKMIATDVHAIEDLNDPYNEDFMRAADILFLSHEKLHGSPHEIIPHIWQKFQTKICVIGMGKSGALLAYKPDKFIGHYSSVITRPIVNTIGAGDALFSAFIDNYAKTGDPYIAIQKAILFASYKIGITGAAEGFLSEQELNDLSKKFLPITHL